MVESAQGASRSAFLERYTTVGEDGIRQLNSSVSINEIQEQYANLSVAERILVDADLSAEARAFINPEGRRSAPTVRQAMSHRPTVGFVGQELRQQGAGRPVPGSRSITHAKSKRSSASLPVRNQNAPVARSYLVLLSGPGGTAFGKDEVSNLAKNLGAGGPSKVSTLGDGAASVTLDDVTARLRELKEDGGPVTVFVQAHGKVDGEHRIKLGNGNWVPTRDFFKAVKNELGDATPVTIFMTSCHGGSATQNAARLLPEGAVFVALAPGEEAVTGVDVERLSNVFARTRGDLDGDNWTESDELLMVYLAKALKNRIGPELAVGGQGYRVLEADLKRRLGKPFSPEERQRIHERLDHIIGRTATSGIIKMIESARDEFAIGAVHYGPALAAVLAAEYWQHGRKRVPRPPTAPPNRT